MIRIKGSPLLNSDNNQEAVYNKYIEPENNNNEDILEISKKQTKTNAAKNLVDGEQNNKIHTDNLKTLSINNDKEEQERCDNRKLLISKYYNNARLSKYIGKEFRKTENELSKMNLQELEEHIELLKKVINSGRSSYEVSGILKYGGQSLELILSQMGFDMNGLASALENNNEIQEDLEMIMMEYNLLSNVSPESRLGLNVISTCFMVHQINKLNKKNIDNKMKQQYIPSNNKNKPVTAVQDTISGIETNVGNNGEKMSIWDYDENEL